MSSSSNNNYLDEFTSKLVAYTQPELYQFLHQNALLLGTVVTLLVILCQYATTYSYWWRHGIPGPIPLSFVGTNLFEFVYSKNHFAHYCSKKYGRVYGLYDGSKPRLVVGDANIIRDITIKDAHNFPNRRKMELDSELSRNMLAYRRDDNWRQLRHLMAPFMTSGKIKRMYDLMKSSSDDLLRMIQRQLDQGEPIDVKLVYGCFTMDVIARTAFAVKLDQGAATNEQSRNKQLVTVFIEQMKCYPLHKLLLGAVVPKFILKPLGFSLSQDHLHAYLTPLSRRVIADRRRRRQQQQQQQNGGRVDLIQILLDLDKSKQITAESVELVEGDSSESHHVQNYDKQELSEILAKEAPSSANTKLANSGNHLLLSNEKKRQKVSLSDDEIVAQCVMFMVAGQDTTASLLSAATYCLACHPKYQELLYQEVEEAINKERSQNPEHHFEYETVLSMEYLDAVISETLRMLPSAPQVDRMANNDYPIKSLGATLPANSLVLIPIMAIHHDPEYFPNPYKYDPSRFLKENRHQLTPYAYLPFGSGVRHCLGMRFALAEAKLALARMVYHFRFTPTLGAKAPFPPKLNKSINLISVKGLDVIFTRRPKIDRTAYN